MRIGIIVYSQTGNTLSVTEKIGAALKDKGHSVQIEKVEPAGEVHPGMKNITFTSNPGVEGYDAVIFGAPVQAFSLCAGMKAYLEQAGSMTDKKIALLVTKQLPGKWTGGSSALRKMRSLCEEKGGEVLGSGMVIWSSKEKDEMIRNTVSEIAGLF